jgi:hypothetical protein
MRQQNHASLLKGIPKTILQGFRGSLPKTLQSQTRRFAKNRLSINALAVVQLFTTTTALDHSIESALDREFRRAILFVGLNDIPSRGRGRRPDGVVDCDIGSVQYTKSPTV